MVLRDELLVATNFTGDDEEAKYDNTDKWKHTSTNNSEITGAELITGVEITGVKIKGVKITEVEVKRRGTSNRVHTNDGWHMNHRSGIPNRDQKIVKWHK